MIRNIRELLPELPSPSSPNWGDLGLPSFLVPSPPPFLPIPRGLIMEVEGLDEWRAYGLRGTIMEDLGTVYGESELEAIEAGENLARTQGNSFTAIRVIRE